MFSLKNSKKSLFSNINSHKVSLKPLIKDFTNLGIFSTIIRQNFFTSRLIFYPILTFIRDNINWRMKTEENRGFWYINMKGVALYDVLMPKTSTSYSWSIFLILTKSFWDWKRLQATRTFRCRSSKKIQFHRGTEMTTNVWSTQPAVYW